MIVVDASAVIEWLLQTPAGRLVEQRLFSTAQVLCAPHLLDLEVAQVLRRLTRDGAISDRRADEAIADLLSVRIARYPHLLLVPRIWQLRHTLSAYDASYVALAESLGGTLLTRDSRLAAASGHTAKVELF